MQELSFMAVGNAALRQVIRRNFHRYFVADGDFDEELAHFAGNVGENFMPVLKADRIHRGRQNLDHSSGYFDCFIVGTCHLNFARFTFSMARAAGFEPATN